MRNQNDVLDKCCTARCQPCRYVRMTHRSVVTTLRSCEDNIPEKERIQRVLVSTSNIVGGIIHKSLVQFPKRHMLLAI